MRNLRRALCAAIMTGLFLVLAPGAGAATVWTATRTDDPPGVGCAQGNCSLRQALLMQNPGSGDSVRVPASASAYTVSPALGRIVINKSATIIGAGARSTRISGGGVTGIFAISAPTGSPVINLSGVTLTGGNDAQTMAGVPGGGGAITPAIPVGTPTVNLTDVAVLGNKASSLTNAIGGGLSFTSGATANLRRVLVSGNEARSTGGLAAGGGIASGAILTLADLMVRDDVSGQVFNIGSSEEISILDLAHRVRDAAESDSEVMLVPYDEAYEPGFEDMPRRVPDLSKIGRVLGWAPTRSLDQILDDVIQSERQGGMEISAAELA